MIEITCLNVIICITMRVLLLCKYHVGAYESHHYCEYLRSFDGVSMFYIIMRNCYTGIHLLRKCVGINWGSVNFFCICSNIVAWPSTLQHFQNWSQCPQNVTWNSKHSVEHFSLPLITVYILGFYLMGLDHILFTGQK